MTRNEVNQFQMLTSVDAVFQQHAETITNMPALAERLVGYRENLSQIRKRDNEYSSIRAGAVATKHSTGDVVTRLVKETMDALYAFGRKTGNEQLKAECHLSWSELGYLREGTFQQLCSRISAFAHTYAEEIAPFGISAADIESLDNAIELFATHVNSVQHKSAESMAAREALSAMFEKTCDMLKGDIDTMMDIFKSRDVDFYTQYKAARSIRNYGQRHSTNGETPEMPEAVVAAVA